MRTLLILTLSLLAGCGATMRQSSPRAARMESVCAWTCSRYLHPLADSMWDGKKSCQCWLPLGRWEQKGPNARSAEASIELSGPALAALDGDELASR